MTTDLDEEPAQFKEEKQKQQRRRSVQFNEEVEVNTPVTTKWQKLDYTSVIMQSKCNLPLKLTIFINY